jgi:hypothetical protein
VRLLDSDSYDELIEKSVANTQKGFLLIPGVCPQWDNEARRPNRGFSLAGSTRAKYGEGLKAASHQAAKALTEDERIVFINAWNEWAEGAYLEPDHHYGYAYLAETLRVPQGLSNPSLAPNDVGIKLAWFLHAAAAKSERRHIVDAFRRYAGGSSPSETAHCPPTLAGSCDMMQDISRKGPLPESGTMGSVGAKASNG